MACRYDAAIAKSLQLPIGLFIQAEQLPEKEIYVSGWEGVLYRWDGRDYWEKIEINDDGRVVNWPIYSPGEFMGAIYVCVGPAGLFKIKGKEAKKIKDVYCVGTTVIDGKLIVTGSDSMAEFDGENWRQIVIALP